MRPAETADENLIAWLAWGAWLGGNGLLLLVAQGRRLLLGRSTFARRWSLLDLWLGAHLMFVLLVLLFGLWAAVIAGLTGRSLVALADAGPGGGGSRAGDFLRLFLLPSAILQNLVFFVVPAGYIVLRYGQRLRDIGLRSLPRRAEVTAGVLLGLFMLAVDSLLLPLFTALAERFRHVDWVEAALRLEQEILAQLEKALPAQGPGTLLLALLAVAVAAPLGEEMLFRGWLFNALKRRLGLRAGLILSALLFTLPHAYFVGFVPVLLAGLLLAWVYHVSGSLWPGIVLHATVNTVAILAAYFFPS